MKKAFQLLVVGIVCSGAVGRAGAAVSVDFGALDPEHNTYTAQYSSLPSHPGVGIPDNNLSGVAFNLSFSDVNATHITGMSVSFTINGGYNGDMYAYLSHGDGFVVLLNRIGRTAGNTDGSVTSGFSSTFTLNSTSPLTDFYDVHRLQQADGSPLGLTYAPDGRNIAPGDSLDTTARTATFASLNLANPNGDWTLFFADAAAGGSAASLTDFSVVVSVPEPVTWALIGFGTFFGTVQLARFYRRRLAVPALDS